MKKISNLIATAVLAVIAATPSIAQTNLGSACGCPSVASRPTVLVSTLATNGGASDGDLLANTIFTCDKTWILDKKIYVPNGKTLTIQPGTVIKGRFITPTSACSALICSRGGQIIADGTADCQIVMTAEADPMDGTYPAHNQGEWGGLIIAGQASNTLTLAKNGPFQAGVGDGRIAVADGLGTFEGFATSDFRDQFGVNMNTAVSGYKTTFDDNDCSGIYRYVSVRYSGAILQVGGEINGISLGSVGRGTIMDHIEVISAADDNMEFWGGTVNVKNSVFMFGNDDMYDFDDGYSGHAQNIFSIKAAGNDTLNGTGGAGSGSGAADNGFECDSDDQQSGNGSGVAIGTIAVGGYRSHPIFYNCTMIGNNKRKETSDNTGMAAIMAKELTEGEWYNCVFANFAVGLNLWTGNKPGEGTRVSTTSSTGQTVLDAYDNWRDNNGTPSLIVKNCTFASMGSGANGASTPASNGATLTLDVAKLTTGSTSYYANPSAHTASPRDTMQFYVTDGNTRVFSIPGMTYNWVMDGSTNSVSTPYNATPSPAIATSITAPADGFFTPESYRGAFATGAPSWMSGWAYASLLQTQGGLAPCPTDINQDGVTNNVDFLLLLGNFNQSCH